MPQFELQQNRKTWSYFDRANNNDHGDDDDKNYCDCLTPLVKYT